MNDTCLTGILTETESCYDRYWRDMEFAANLIEQQREMERFVNESIIRASGNKKAINEMVIINEAAFGDKIKGFFTKIKNFFKKIFDKLGAAMNGLFMEQKKYIDKYANIVTKCKYQATDVDDVKDHFQGLPNIIDAVDNSDSAIIGTNSAKYFDGENVPTADGGEIKISDQYPYDNADRLIEAAKKLPEKINLDNIREKAIDEFVKEGYWANKSDFKKENNENGNGIDIDKSFRNYFDGSADTVGWTKEYINDNFQTIINTTYAGPSYLTRLEKIVASVNKKMDEASAKMEKYYKAQQQKIQEGIKNISNKGGTESKLSSNDWNSAKTETKEVDDNGKKVTVKFKIIDGKTYEWDGNTGQSEAQAQSDFEKNNPSAKTYDATKDKDGNKIQESYNYYHEITGSGDNKDSTKDTHGPTGAGATERENANKAVDSINKLQSKSPEAKDSTTHGVKEENKEEVLKAANSLLDIDIYNRQARVNADVQISSSIARAIFNSFQLTNKDFWWIIQRHVQWYLANPGEEGKSENARAKVSSLDMNAGTQKVNVSQESKPTNQPTQSTT